MRKALRRKEEKRAARKRDRVIAKLSKGGARFIANAEQLRREQDRMLARFAEHDVPRKNWKGLTRCRSGRCSSSPCSAACWFGERGKTNDLMLAAARILKGTEKPLYFVTIIDPHYAVPVGNLASVSITGVMSSLRRRFRQAGDMLKDDPAFGFLEVALEVLPDGRRMWFAHVHIVLASNASRSQVRAALQPRRAMPNAEDWGRKRWKPVVVKPVSNLVNLLAYNAKRAPEENRVTSADPNERVRFPSRMPSEFRLEHDLWLLAQRPADRVFKRRMKEVHGKLIPLQLEP